MTTKGKDEMGKRYSFLTVIARAGRDKDGDVYWMCSCSCGGNSRVNGASLRSGKTKSCGCLQRNSVTKHGMHSTAEYRAWSSMHTRCFNKKVQNWRRYGGRGISIHPRWRRFENFLADMGCRPTPKHSLDRINNDGNYEPGNCRWATAGEQRVNASNTINKMSAEIIRFLSDNSGLTWDELAKAIGVSKGTISVIKNRTHWTNRQIVDNYFANQRIRRGLTAKKGAKA